MKRQPINTDCRTPGAFTLLAAMLTLGAMLAMPARADNLNPPTAPGGIQISPVIVGPPIPSGSNALLNIEGLQAPYMILVSSNGADWQNAGVTSLKHPNFSGTCLATNLPPTNAFFRLMMLGSENWVGKYNPGALVMTNIFMGSDKCVGCHNDKVTQWSSTAHAQAVYEILNPDGSFRPGRSEFCLSCHTVGKNQPGGFVDLATTPHLANVQCENCHGNANAHINISGRQYHPINSLAAETCGACHEGEHHPTIEEWEESGHSRQDSHIVDYFVGSGSQSRQASCGACHSTATRMAMLANYNDMLKGITNYIDMPSPTEATNYATASCAVCHDPHSTNIYAAQLRYPMWSTNFYTFTTTTAPVTKYSTNHFGVITTNIYYANTPFANQYNPNIQVCGQCHNSRGALWTDTSRPPHHSPQYNMLVGTVQEGYLSTNLTSRHGGITKSSTTGVYNTNQCVTCHVVGYAPMTNGVVITTNYATGHSFELNYNGCALAGCHTSDPVDVLKEDLEAEQLIRKTALSNVVSKLNYWALNVAPTITNAFATYGQYAWEYTTAGQLSNPDGLTSIVGPPTALQARIPNEIKQARFNIYMFEHDGSYGIHNRQLGPLLLSDAQTKVEGVINASTNKAFFTVISTNAFTGAGVAFTTYAGSGTSYSWNFGDGGTSTSANPTHAYAAVGTYTVTLTANGTDVFSRIINVYETPVVSFTGSPLSGPAPLTVTFANTSVNTASVTAWRWTVRSGINITTNATVFSYTYTSPSTNSVSLRATTPVGNTTVTSNAFIIVTAP